MNICTKCNNPVQANEVIKTNYFQLYGEDSEAFHVCPTCYIKLIEQYLNEPSTKCDCGAKLTLGYNYDLDEAIDLAIHDSIIPLTCTYVEELIKTKNISQDDPEFEKLTEEHDYNSFLYLY